MGKHIKTLKTFLQSATESGLNNNIKFQSKGFKTITSDSDNIALSENELSAISNLDLFYNEKLDKVRDLFLIGANTGLRFSDFSIITPDNIRKVKNGYNLDIIQTKGKGRVIIPLNDTVLSILHKYNNQLPKAISNQKFNDYIKEVAQLVDVLHEPFTQIKTRGGIQSEVTSPKWDLVSSHTARRSFATNQYRKGVPSKSIMAITGHQKEESFLKYLKISDTEHAEIMRKHQ